MSTTPARSPVLDAFRGAPTETSGDMRVAAGGPAIEPGRAMVADLSGLSRRLVVGAGAPGWLESRGAPLPAAPGDCVETREGAVVAALRRAHYLLVDAPAGGALAPCFEATAARDGDVLVMPCEAAEFALTGPGLDRTYAELCACPPARLAADAWLATRFAHVEAGLRRIDTPAPHLRITVSPADARTVFDVLCAVVGEAGGEATTLDAYRAWLTGHAA